MYSQGKLQFVKIGNIYRREGLAKENVRNRVILICYIVHLELIGIKNAKFVDIMYNRFTNKIDKDKGNHIIDIISLKVYTNMIIIYFHTTILYFLW